MGNRMLAMALGAGVAARLSALGVAAALVMLLLPGTLAAQGAVPAAPEPVMPDTSTLDRAREVAEKAAKTFAETLQGQALLIGVTETQPGLKLNYHSTEGTGAVTVEEYSGQASRGFLLSLESASSSDLKPIVEGSAWLGSFGMQFTTTYGTFRLAQTLQKGTSGKTAGGEVSGDFLGFAIPVQYKLARDNDVLPFAIGWGGGIGKALVRYEAPLRYSVDSTDYEIHVQSDGYYARNMIFTFIDIRVWNILYRFQAISMTGGESYAKYRGRRVFTFTDEFTLNLQTLAYVWNF